jgi:hypothetical protein
MEERNQKREASYVAMMVLTLIKRFKAKLNECTKRVDHEEVVRTSGIKGIVSAMDEIETLNNNITSAIDAHAEATDSFNEIYGEECSKLCDKAEDERVAEMAEKSRKFEFTVRKSIGLVELVSGAAAFEVLETARNEIEDLT